MDRRWMASGIKLMDPYDEVRVHGIPRIHVFTEIFKSLEPALTTDDIAGR
jgi:hypothetical protein